MGAWGLGLFESDHDFDRISEMSHEIGLPALEDKAKAKLKKERPKLAAEIEKAGHGDMPILSLYAEDCGDIDMVRQYLDSGVLASFIEKKKADIIAAKSNYWPRFWSSTWALYELVLLGACAMSLGCKLPGDFKAELASQYRKSGLMRDAVVQMQMALSDGDKRYKEGTPYDFSAKTLIDAANLLDAQDEGKDKGRGFRMLNVPAPFGFFPTGGTAAEARTPEYPNNVCGGCGSKERGDGKELLVCGMCKAKKYCGKVCQAGHYKQHKPFCKG